MKKNQNQPSSDEELRFENEFRKLKMSLETGARFYTDGDQDGEDIPLEIEKQFLDKVEAFEKALCSAGEILFYDFLGQPDFKKEADLSDEELLIELDKLLELMDENEVECHAIYEVDDRVFYKFITEELFRKLTRNVKFPGFIKHFIYEEFHPNHKEDIKLLVLELIGKFIDNQFSEDYRLIHVDCNNNFTELLTFRNLFLRLGDAVYDEVALNISGHLATIKYRMAYDGYVSEASLPIHYEGDGLFRLEYDTDIEFWKFSHIKLPGMRTKAE